MNLWQGTTYEVRLTLEGTSTTETILTTTWAEAFPVGQTVYLPELSNETLTISASGTPSGYILYTASPGKAAVIDGNGASSYNIRISGSYIIVRGLTLRNASVDAIRISGSSHDVVIDGNAISHWGPTGSDASENRAAVYAESGAGPRLVIQNNTMFDPNGNSNDWNSGHPLGPKAIFLYNNKGNVVIRSNKIYSGPDHYFNDGIGGRDNRGPIGNVFRDSDIYGNEVSQCWDDGLEIEGDNINVRVWDNRINHCFVGIAMSSTAVGPLYVFRNLVTDGARSTGQPGDAFGFKMGDTQGNYGAIYLYHNTVAGPNVPRNGAHDSGGAIRYVTTRNNIFGGTGTSVDDGDKSSTNSFDYDLYNGNINAVSGSEAHGIKGVATFEPASYSLAANSLGLDQGVVIPGFNDGYQGSAPDMGAYERGELESPTFVDVPFDHPYYNDIETLYRSGYTAGCNADPLMYCPDNTMNRAESSVFVERGIHSATYDPAAPSAQVFADVPLDSWAAKWVDGLWRDQYTAGCGTVPLVYCPWQGHTRAEATVFYVRMLNGYGYEPPPPPAQQFVDVPLDVWYARWVHAAYAAGLIEPCQISPDLRFCPDAPLSRGLAAHMMVKAKGLGGSPPTPVFCLAGSGPLLTIRGEQTTTYSQKSLAAGSRIDAATAVWNGNAQMTTPVTFGGEAGLCWHAGEVNGGYPLDTAWDVTHDTYAVRVYSANSIIESVRTSTIGDGISFYPPADNFVIRGAYMNDMRDDCIEGDFLPGGLIEDSLLEGCYVPFGFRTRPEDTTSDGRNKTLEIRDTLAWLRDQVGVYRGPVPGHGKFFKWPTYNDGGGPERGLQLSIHNSILRVDSLASETPSEQFRIPDDGNGNTELISCSNNTLVWFGSSDINDFLNATDEFSRGEWLRCFTLTTDQSVWNNAVLLWKTRHGL